MATRKVLSTKALEPSLVQAAKQQGIEIIEQDAIRVNAIHSKEKWNEVFSLLEQKPSFVVFTSYNAVYALKKYLAEYINPVPVSWKVFCLSGKTKEAVMENAELLGEIIDTAESGAALAEKIKQHAVEKVAFFCGNRRRDELPQILTEAGVKVQEVVIYETVETPVPASENFEAVLFFSPSAVQSFFSVNKLSPSIVCFAIGHTTATSLEGFTTNKVIQSKEQSQESMVAAVVEYFVEIQP